MNAPIDVKNLLPTSGLQQGSEIIHESAHLHVTGTAPYTDDVPELAGTLHCALGLDRHDGDHPGRYPGQQPLYDGLGAEPDCKRQLQPVSARSVLEQLCPDSL